MPQSPQRAHGLGTGAQGAEAGASSLSPTPTLTDVHQSPPTSVTASGVAECSRASPRLKHAPLLTLSPSIIPDLDPQHEEDISVIWNVISRAADVVKDGERLENIAWRHWGAPRANRRRRSSSTTAATESSADTVATPLDHHPALPRTRSFERRSFTGTLKLLVEETSFKDWVGDARKKQLPEKLSPIQPHAPTPTSPTLANATAGSLSTNTTTPSTPNLSVPPDTPVANLKIHLVEPTPVPSRVGSLGGSLGTTTSNGPYSRGASLVPEDITEVTTEPELVSSPTADTPDETATAAAPQARNRRANNNRFFIQSSPGKVSGSSSSQPSSIPRAAPPVPEPAQAGSLGSHFRSSAESSSAIVIKKKERRHVSMANMRGRFAGEKARAAQAIAARNQPPEESDNDDEDWEDDDGDEEDDEGGEGEGDDDDDDWEDEPSTVLEKAPIVPLGRHGSRHVAPPPPAPTPPKTKKERAADKARLEAERDAQHKREMFAKQRIFQAPKANEGLLTRTFRTGKSMVDLTQAGEESEAESGLRRAPTAGQLSNLSSSPGPSALLRSKSSAAMPVESGVSVTSHSHHSGASEEPGTARLPPSGPEALEMETSDEESDEDDYLQSEEVRAKLNALAAKREERERAKAMPQPVNLTGSDLDPNGIVRPLSPSTRRRQIIMREMSESLRKNLIVEREKSSGRPPNMTGPHKRPPPSVHPSRLPTSSSAVNLAQYHAAVHGGEPLQRHMSNQVHDFKRSQLERHSSHPNLTAMNVEHPTSPTPPPSNAAASVSPEHRRRSNVLGSGFLRPLTRVEGQIGRTHSVAALSGLGVTSPTSDNGPSPNAHSHSSAHSGHSAGRMHPLQAPPMQRSSTEGGKDMERARLRKELAKRGDHTDTSYRFHGW